MFLCCTGNANHVDCWRDLTPAFSWQNKHQKLFIELTKMTMTYSSVHGICICWQHMYLTRLPNANAHAYICVAHLTIFACLFHQDFFQRHCFWRINLLFEEASFDRVELIYSSHLRVIALLYRGAMNVTAPVGGKAQETGALIRHRSYWTRKRPRFVCVLSLWVDTKTARS
jgi:hypothetical protein